MTDEERQRYEFEREHRAAQTTETWQVSRAAALADAFARGADLQRGLIRAFATSADPAEIDAVMSPTVPDDLGAEVPARRLLDAVREALGPTCADATNEALPGLVAEVVACDAEMHREVDARGERLREMAAEVAHLEARRGALLAEVDRLTAARYVGGGNTEDWERLAISNADARDEVTAELLAAREALAAARLDGAREMREQPVAWGAMPTAAEVAARCKGREEPHRGAPWMRRHADTSGDFVEVVYLRAIDGLMFHREPDGAVWYLMRAVHETSRWRPINDDGASAQEVARG